ncbi:head maturation protease, ClpP-related [Pikeienuella sp. HZG-20]|uniref:head maturation protease, ClpP-related n=1 Tax=Paludibacillus litoralis TaxID=3133267 RepID=UPI0030EEBB30
MSLKKINAPRAFDRPAGYSWDAPADALARWSEAPAVSAEAGHIQIFGMIGEDMFDEGVTATSVRESLARLGATPVTVDINSPGGDMFEGLAIFNLLDEHPAEVTVRVFGVAASAASLVAMAGDKVLMGAGSVMMVHKAWGIVVGNEHDFKDAATVFNTFDRSMASIYAARTGMSEEDALALLDGPNRGSDGTYMSAAEAIEKGFADDAFDGKQASGASAAAIPGAILARRKVEAALARDGVGRKDRAAMINNLSGQRDATRPAARDAGDFAAGLQALLTTIRS